MGAARALSDFSGESACSSLLATLDDSLGRSTDVGKTTVSLLAHHAAGRAALADYLGEEIDRRTRVEAAIVLARVDALRESASSTRTRRS